MSFLVGCAKEESNPDFVKETVELKISSVELIDFKDPVTKLIIDKKNSNIVLSKDGTAKITLMLNPIAISMVNILLSTLNLSETGLLGLDIDGFFSMYPAGIFPGLSINDMAGAFELIKASIGLQILGLDFEDPVFAELATTLSNNGTLPDGFLLPKDKDYAIILTAPYVIRELSSPYSGDYTAVYLGELRENEEPYVIMTAQKDDTGKINQLRLHVEFLQLTVLAAVA